MNPRRERVLALRLPPRNSASEWSAPENGSVTSSAVKGETIEDTMRVFNEYGVDAIVLRTKEDGYAARAASVSKIAVINGGDGKGEHPTQAVLDMYTIQEQLNQLDWLNVVMGGDLAHGRTVRSLSKLLSLYPDNHISFLSTPGIANRRGYQATPQKEWYKF